MAGVSRSVFRLLPVLCLSASGCLAMYSKRTVEISVKDAGTNTAAVGVPVEVEYCYVGVLNAPSRAQGTTDQRGLVVLPMADFQNGFIVLKVGDRDCLVDEKAVREGGRTQTPAHTVTITPQDRGF